MPFVVLSHLLDGHFTSHVKASGEMARFFLVFRKLTLTRSSSQFIARPTEHLSETFKLIKIDVYS